MNNQDYNMGDMYDAFMNMNFDSEEKTAEEIQQDVTSILNDFSDDRLEELAYQLQFLTKTADEDEDEDQLDGITENDEEISSEDEDNESKNEEEDEVEIEETDSDNEDAVDEESEESGTDETDEDEEDEDTEEENTADEIYELSGSDLEKIAYTTLTEKLADLGLGLTDYISNYIPDSELALDLFDKIASVSKLYPEEPVIKIADQLITSVFEKISSLQDE